MEKVEHLILEAASLLGQIEYERDKGHNCQCENGIHEEKDATAEQTGFVAETKTTEMIN